jgi:cathepsin A (carboxypeptidase C)
VLGVDKVKQYSGYLDDEEEDKHLFYCEYLLGLLPCLDTNT